ncbi:MAG: hypothetical protein WBD86_01590 [Microgenomates group bacterium]
MKEFEAEVGRARGRVFDELMITADIAKSTGRWRQGIEVLHETALGIFKSEKPEKDNQS